MNSAYHISSTFHDISWSAAQSTGALAFVDCATAQEYSGSSQTQNVFDTTGGGPHTPPDIAQAISVKQHIEIVEGQLLLLNDLATNLNTHYKTDQAPGQLNRFTQPHHIKSAQLPRKPFIPNPNQSQQN
jgi:hypothetical protein